MAQPLGLFGRLGEGGHVLCLGAHSDDIEIGCAGFIARLVSRAVDLSVDWVVFSATGVRRDEARASAGHLLSPVSKKEVMIESFRNGFFPYAGSEIKEYFETLKTRQRPDLILTHRRADLHQDHRVISELTWNTFRDHLILEYEIPKYDADLGAPNVFVTLTEREVDNKWQILSGFFPSQREKQWFSAETFRGLCRLRGVECNSPTGFSEGFYARKLLVD